MMKDKMYAPYESVDMYSDMIVDTHDREEIDDCINSDEVEVRRLVALNKHLNKEQIKQLMNDSDGRVVELIKLNKHYQSNEKLKEIYNRKEGYKNEYER